MKLKCIIVNDIYFRDPKVLEIIILNDRIYLKLNLKPLKVNKTGDPQGLLKPPFLLLFKNVSLHVV